MLYVACTIMHATSSTSHMDAQQAAACCSVLHSSRQQLGQQTSDAIGINSVMGEVEFSLFSSPRPWHACDASIQDTADLIEIQSTVLEVNPIVFGSTDPQAVRL